MFNFAPYAKSRIAAKTTIFDILDYRNYSRQVIQYSDLPLFILSFSGIEQPRDEREKTETKNDDFSFQNEKNLHISKKYRTFAPAKVFRACPT